MSIRSRKERRHRRRCLDKGRLTVKLSTMNGYPHADVILAEIQGWGAHEWAEWDGYIGGSTWETPGDMPGFAYAMPCNSPRLVEDLRREGYELDLSEYCEPIESCEDADCEGKDCPWSDDHASP